MTLAALPSLMPPRNPAEQEAGVLRFDLATALSVLRRNAVLIGSILATATLAALVLTLLTTPTYVATARIQIDQEADRVLESAEVQPQAGYADAERFLRTQTDVLRSRSLSVRVAQRLKLFGNPGFFAAMEAPLPTAGARPAAIREATLRLLQTHLAVDLPDGSRIAAISFESPDPALAARIANSYAAEFIQANLQRKFDSSAYARDFLSRQLAAAKLRLEGSERALNDYARAARLIRTSGGTDDGALPSVTTASLAQLNATTNDARAARIAAEQKWRAVADAPLMNIPDVLGNLAIQRLLEQRAAGAVELQRERARHLGGHPNVRQLEVQQAEFDRQIAAIAGSIRGAIHDGYRDALGRERAMVAEVDVLKGATLGEQDRSVRYTILAREADTSRTLYDGLLQRYKELSAAAGVSANNLSVVDVAEAPLAPSSPRLVLTLAVALIAGLAVAAAAVLVREQLDDSVRVVEDIEVKLRLPVLGVIPHAVGVAEQIDQPRSAVYEAYNALRGALLHASTHGLPRTLLVTSSQPGEGKSTSAQAIAVGLARLGKRVVLVDVDLRRPALHLLLDVRNDVGLSDVLTRHAPLEAAVQHLATRGFALLPSGPHAPSPTELLASAGMADTIAALVARFDVVVLDAPPVLGLADAPMLAAQAEATLFVVEANRPSHGATKAALRRLRGADAGLLGAVLSKFDPRRAGLGRGYYGHDYHQYGTPSAAQAAE